MEKNSQQALYEDRQDAGRRTAKALSDYRDSSAQVLAISADGIPIAQEVAHRLKMQWNLLVPLKLLVPSNPKAAFGAVSPDGAVVLNEPMVHGLHLTKEQIQQITASTLSRAVQQAELYAGLLSPVVIKQQSVLLLDDGMISGYTMLAAIKSVRKQGAEKVVASVPVASRYAASLITDSADECHFGIVSPSVPFSVLDYYLQWHELSYNEVMALLKPAA